MNTIHARTQTTAAMLAVCLLLPVLASAQTVQTDPFELAVQQLSDSNPATRRRGADKLGRLRNPEAVPHLMRLLDDPEAMVRMTAVDSLGLLRAKDALGRIISMLGSDKNSQVRQQAANALSYYADNSSESALIAALGDDAVGVRYAAARALGTMRSKKAAPKLVKALDEDDPGMRRAAAAALVRIRAPQTIPALKKCLSDDDVYVRREAVKALGVMGEEAAAAGDLRPLLKDPDSLVRIDAAAALSELGDTSGEKTVLDLLSDEDVRIRQQAANALGAIGTRAVGLPALERSIAAEKDPRVMKALEFAQARLKARLGIRDEAPGSKSKGKGK